MAFNVDEILAKIKAQIPPDLIQKLGKIGPLQKILNKNSATPEDSSAQEATKTKTKTDSGDKTTITKVNTQAGIETTEASPEGATESGKEDPSKNKNSKNEQRSKIIRLVVIVGLIYTAVDMFILNPEGEQQPAEQVAQPTDQPKKKKKKKDQPAAEGQVEEQSGAQVANDAVTPPVDGGNPANPVLDTSGAVQGSANVDNSIPQVDVPVDTTAMSTGTIEQPKMEEIPTQPQVTEQSVVGQDTASVATGTSDAQLSGTTGEPSRNPSESVGGGEGISSNNDQIILPTGEAQPVDVVKEESKGPNQVDQMINQLNEQKKNEYVAPPTYEELGRGLVYNCKERHWACLDRDAYFKCRDNMTWNKNNTKPKECVAINVYATNDDCQTIQSHNINTREKTDFCSE